MQISAMSDLVVVGCSRDPIFPDFGKFLEFLKSRSDSVIELFTMSGSTAAVGVDGKMSIRSCTVSDDEVKAQPVEKELLYKVVDRTVLVYPLGFV